MTRKEAIDHLMNDWFKTIDGKFRVETEKVNDFLEAVGIGITAIKEQLKNETE